MPPEGSLAGRAARFAQLAHGKAGQTRDGSGLPYITHPAAVAFIVASVPHTEEMLAAAWLHDVVEDCDVAIAEIADRFGPCVSDLVGFLTNTPSGTGANRAMRKALDRERLRGADPRAQTIKVADIIVNSRTVVDDKPKFARQYLSEKQADLAALPLAQPLLLARARSIVAGELSRIGPALEGLL